MSGPVFMRHPVVNAMDDNDHLWNACVACKAMVAVSNKSHNKGVVLRHMLRN